jgi:DNA processing protein
VTTADDVLDELGDVGELLRKVAPAQAPAPETVAAKLPLNDDERAILACLNGEEQSLEMIAAATDRPVAKVASVLINLQLKGLARQMPGNLFVRARKA